ncbi:MAG: hypothetical protein HDT07_02850 [Bacteroidales bacterium]|nr:hypothetical protein [Bacteroidales bacterium]
MERNFLADTISVIEKGHLDTIKDIIAYYFSETEDNMRLGNNLSISSYKNPYTKRNVRGLKLGDIDLPNMSYIIENDETVLQDVSKLFPSLSKEQIEDYFRLVTLIFSSLEKEADDKKRL